jgi:methylenetetrahydrofolate reductase (NADPH)
MKKIAQILREKKRTYSFEVSPPRTAQGAVKFWENVEQMAIMEPDWFSVTYGAGGSTRDTTTELVEEMIRRFGIPVIHHLTCMGHTENELKTKIAEIKARGICNVLALRGDVPKGADPDTYFRGDYLYCHQLIKLLCGEEDYFSIGVAGFPEGHPECPDLDTDARRLKDKVNAGSDFVVTQLFLDNRDYFRYVAKVRRLGVEARIIPGILPVTDYQVLLKACTTCSARIPPEVHDLLRPLESDSEALYKAGVAFTIRQCEELLREGAPGLQIFTFNKAEPTGAIMRQLRPKFSA